VPFGTPGQLIVHGLPGVSLMRGYYKNPAATAEAVRDGWLWTGDNVRERDDGRFEFVDRAKDMIKRAGENVSAIEVESVIVDHPQVAEAAIIGVPDPIRDEAVAAVIVVADGAELTDVEITAYCQERLSRFKVPTIVAFETELPKTSIGKVRKDELRKKLEGAEA